MASDILQKASQQVLDVFTRLPRPKELEGFDVWQMVHDDGSTVIFQSQMQSGSIRDEYYSWVCAKILSEGRTRRFAVGIRWPGDELAGDDESVYMAVAEKVTRAVLDFRDMAEEYQEGGPLPIPIVGVGLLHPDRSVRVRISLSDYGEFRRVIRPFVKAARVIKPSEVGGLITYEEWAELAVVFSEKSDVSAALRATGQTDLFGLLEEVS